MKHDIKLFAISYDSEATLKAFAAKHGITFPLLSDTGSTYIRQLGILNRSVPQDSKAYGIPHPGIYFVGTDGKVFDKWFHESYTVRDVAASVLADGFHIPLDPAQAGASETRDEGAVHVTARLDSPTYCRGARVGLSVELQIPAGWHTYGKPIPDGFIPTEVTIEPMDGVTVEPIEMPRPKPFLMAGLDDKFFVYAGTVRARTHLVFEKPAGDRVVKVNIRYQTCNDRMCRPPQQLTLTLPIREVPLTP